MTDIMPFIYAFGGMWLFVGAGVAGWASNLNNRARLRRAVFKQNSGVAEIIGDGLQSKEHVVDMSDSLAMFPNQQELIRIETRDKEGKSRFYLRDGVPRMLYNKNKAVPLELQSKVTTVWLCPVCEREVDDPTEYTDEKKLPVCPWSCLDKETGKVALLESKQALSSIDPLAVGNVEVEQEHLFTIFGLVYGIALAKAKKGIEKYLKSMDWIKYLVIGIALVLVVLLYMTYQNTQLLTEIAASLKPAAATAVQNVTKP